MSEEHSLAASKATKLSDILIAVGGITGLATQDPRIANLEMLRREIEMISGDLRRQTWRGVRLGLLFISFGLIFISFSFGLIFTSFLGPLTESSVMNWIAELLAPRFPLLSSLRALMAVLILGATAYSLLASIYMARASEAIREADYIFSSFARSVIEAPTSEPAATNVLPTDSL